MSSQKYIQGKEVFARMNFLYQAANHTLKIPSQHSMDLAVYYGSLLRNIGKKATQRLDPEIKRTLCKGCNLLLTPGETAKVRLKKKPSSCVIWTCLRCLTIKRFVVSKNYEIWAKKKEAFVETVQLAHQGVKNSIDLKCANTNDNKKEQREKHDYLWTNNKTIF